jgi:predicted metal-dependent hydrolase
MAPMTPPLKYLTGYPEPMQAQVRDLLDAGTLGERLSSRYTDQHEVRTDGALYDYAMALKNRYMRSSPPLSKVVFDNKLQVVEHALGLNTMTSRVQGSQLKAKREIRIAGVFRTTPADFLKMIVVHELAHLKERAHDKAFYQLCTHMEPDYHQLEFDLRVYLTWREAQASRAS